MTNKINVHSGKDQWLEALLQAAPVGFVVVNGAGKIFRFNQEAQNLFGYTEEEVIGESIEKLIPKRFLKQHDYHRQQYMASPNTRRMGPELDLFARRRDGQEFPVEIGIGPVQVEDETYVVAVVIDITEKVEAEAAQWKAQAEKMSMLYEEFMTVASPLLSVWEGVMVMPLIGTLDSRRSQDAMEKALTGMAENQVRVLIVDITGVVTVDTMVADHLLQMAAAVRLMGGEVILTGLSPEVARTVVHLGVDLSDLKTRATLAQGLALAVKIIAAEKENIQWNTFQS